MRILLVQPDSNKTCIGFKRLARPEPLALETVAGTVPDHEVRIFDMRVDPNLERVLGEFQPDMVGTTGFTAEVPHAQEVCATVRSTLPDAKVVVGGHHVTMSPAEFDRSDVDIIVAGEGEQTFPQLVQTIEDGGDLSKIPGIGYKRGDHIQFNPARIPLHDLDQVPWPRRDLVSHYRSDYFFRFWDNVYSIETTRGCPFRCNFCSVWAFFGGKVRFKSPERVVAEIEALPSDCEYFCIVDDNFLASMPRTRRIVQMMNERGIEKKFWIQGRADAMVKDPEGVAMAAKAGLSTVLMGLEAYREDELGQFNKGKDASVAVNDRAIEIMHDNGVDIWGCFLIHPDWEERDFEGLIEYVKRKKIEFLQFTILTPLPGTKLYEETKDRIWAGWEKFDFFHSVVPTKLPPERFYEQMATLYRETVMSFSTMKEMIRQGRIPRQGLQRARDMLAQVTDPTSYLDGVQIDLKEQIQTRLADAQATLERLRVEVGSVQVELGARLQLRLEDVQGQLEGLQNDARAAQSELSNRLQQELRGIQSQVEALQVELGQRLRSPLEGLQSEVREALGSRVDGLMAEVQTIQTEMAGLMQRRPGEKLLHP
ncbi:MAG TPA: radical SAM protein [Chloroflexota bacterium]|nr:radical SAM protein [Chloroflexota bacterium]